VATLRAGAAAEAPLATITGVQRLGIHAQPTRLVVSFSAEMDPTRASDAANYRLIAAGPDGRLGTADDRVVRLRGVSYDAATRTATIRPARRLSLRGRFQLVVSDAGMPGLADREGRALDGDGDGRAGGRFLALVSHRNLLLTQAARRAPQVPRRSR
jgi:hypothetical protein